MEEQEEQEEEERWEPAGGTAEFPKMSEVHFVNTDRMNEAEIENDENKGDLSIENERLRTTVFILNQKVRVMEDNTRECDERLQSKINQLISINRLFEQEVETLQNDLASEKQQSLDLRNSLRDAEAQITSLTQTEKNLRTLNQKLQLDIEEINRQLDSSNMARNDLRNQLSRASEKMIRMEEQVYEARQRSKDRREGREPRRREYKDTLGTVRKTTDDETLDYKEVKLDFSKYHHKKDTEDSQSRELKVRRDQKT